MPFEHVVLFRLHDGTDADEVVRVLDASAPVGDPELLSWRVRRSCDERKGVVIAEHAVFAEESAFLRFRESAPHREAGAFLAARADWLVADWSERRG